MYASTNDLQETHLKYKSQLSSGYWQEFQDVMNEDLCPDLEEMTNYFGNVTTCRNFIYGIP